MMAYEKPEKQVLEEVESELSDHSCIIKKTVVTLTLAIEAKVPVTVNWSKNQGTQGIWTPLIQMMKKTNVGAHLANRNGMKWSCNQVE